MPRESLFKNGDAAVAAVKEVVDNGSGSVDVCGEWDIEKEMDDDSKGVGEGGGAIL